jgi:flagellar basal-body rod protein FlgC
MSLFQIFDVSGSAMTAQSLRLNTTASNLANAESVAGNPRAAYKARHPIFASLMNEFGATTNEDESAVGVRVLGIVESSAPALVRYQPDHPMADAKGNVYVSNVNSIEEMTNMIAASRSFQSNVEIINTSRDLLLKTITMGARG